MHAEAAGISAIGNEAPIAFAVSPDYVRTHFVAAVAVAVGGCDSDCTHLWISRDAGGTWRRAASLSSGGGGITIVESRPGVESLAASNGEALSESDDDGGTWHAVGAAGSPVETTAFGTDSLVVANPRGNDYVLTGSVPRSVSGSGGADADLAFDVTSPAPGARFAPALLAADDPHSGAPVVLQCDADLSCANPAPLTGSDPRTGADVSLLATGGYASSGVVYARTTNGLYRSRDGGRRFLPIPVPQQAGAAYTTVPAAVLGGSGMSQLYAAVLSVVGTGRSRFTAGGVFTSLDSGVTWHAVGSPGPLDGGATAVTVTPDGRLIAGYVDAHGSAGLVCSVDGQRWEATCPAESATCSTSCASAPATLSTQSATAATGAAVVAEPGVPGTRADVPVPARIDSVTVPSSVNAPSHVATIVLAVTAFVTGAVAFVLVSTRRRALRRSRTR